jgi:hypothetical protein
MEREDSFNLSNSDMSGLINESKINAKQKSSGKVIKYTNQDISDLIPSTQLH